MLSGPDQLSPADLQARSHVLAFVPRLQRSVYERHPALGVEPHEHRCWLCFDVFACWVLYAEGAAVVCYEVCEACFWADLVPPPHDDGGGEPLEAAA